MKIIEMDNFGKIPANYTGIIIRTQTETKYWYENRFYHREDGPAIECADGHKEWWVKGRRHRLDGLAIEYPDGSGQWFIYGKQYSKINLKNYVVLGHDKGEYEIMWYRLLDKDRIFEYPDIPGLIIK